MSDFSQTLQKMMQQYMQPQTQMKFPSLTNQSAPSLLTAYGDLRNQINPAQQPTQTQPPQQTPNRPQSLLGPEAAPVPAPQQQQQPQANAAQGQPRNGIGGKGGSGSSQGPGSVSGALMKLALL